MMIGAIAGDIIGSRFEGHSGPPSDFSLFHSDCRFTDDSVCTLAVADALMGDRDYAKSLRTFVRRHPHRGYGGMFIQWALTDGASPYGSWGNGAPMRVSPIGWLARSEEEVCQEAANQAGVSHNHPDAIAAAQAVALAIFHLNQGTDIASLRRHLGERFNYKLAPETALAKGGSDVSASGTVPPALTGAFEATGWEDAVRKVIDLGGDTDTLACITGAVAEAIHGVPADIAATAKDYLTADLYEVLETFESVIEMCPSD